MPMPVSPMSTPGQEVHAVEKLFHTINSPSHDPFLEMYSVLLVSSSTARSHNEASVELQNYKFCSNPRAMLPTEVEDESEAF
ncbi:hypothetical protein BWQ96_10574 [Gracilariopsis chorda]|uniref:Uncharacterized protein n=1 Tax=Gracilariopsis chorda TaxID=448386 RepID=A0A2V3ICA1_9FLOR|nr:hypothetical protein BWQ96_10574 [Gracilariopsis chorda]|eukprot:PXF39725.1 hypothetical protein BWQ96_10574 [Gracilariopsis chorda]